MGRRWPKKSRRPEAAPTKRRRLVTATRVSRWRRRRAFRQVLQVLNDGRGKLARLYFGRSLHLALEIIGDTLLLYGLGKGVSDGPAGLAPAHMVQHHNSGKHDRRWVYDVLVGVLGRGSMSRLENGSLVTDIGSGRHPEAAYLSRRGVRDVISIEIGSRYDRILVGPNQYLLEHRVRYSVFD